MGRVLSVGSMASPTVQRQRLTLVVELFRCVSFASDPFRQTPEDRLRGKKGVSASPGQAQPESAHHLVFRYERRELCRRSFNARPRSLACLSTSQRAEPAAPKPILLLSDECVLTQRKVVGGALSEEVGRRGVSSTVRRAGENALAGPDMMVCTEASYQRRVVD